MFIKLLKRFIPQFKWRIVAYILLNIICSICSVFSFIAIIPLVQIIFGISNQTIEYISTDNISSYSSALDILVNNILYNLQEHISIDGPIWVLIVLGCFVVLMSFLSNIVSYFAYWVRIPIRTGISRDLRWDAYYKIIHAPLDSFTKENKGDFVSRMTNDVEEIEYGVGSTLDMLIKDPIQIIIYTTTLVSISPTLTTYAMSSLIVVCVVVFVIGNKMKHISLLAQKLRGKILSTFEETIASLQIIKAYNAEDILKSKFERLNNFTRDTFNKQNRHFSLAWPCTDFLAVIIIVFVLCIGGILLLKGNVIIGAAEFIAFLCVLYSIIPPTRDMMKCTYGIRKSVASVERLIRITNLSKEDNDNKSKKIIPINNYMNNCALIEFKNISFSYDEIQVLKNVSFKIFKGKKIAVVGQIGSGKTSIINLILRFYKAQKGKIYFQGVDIDEYSYNDIRDQICYVSQDTIIFNDTIFNNIAIGKPGATMEEVIQAAKLAHIHDFIMTTPNQYDTNVGDRGSNLSGGQQQCITLARAFLKNAPIYIFDEATSSIDIEHESKIRKSIETILKEKTVIYITHRIYEINGFDNVLIVNDGNLVQSNHEGELNTLIDKYIRIINNN